MLEWRNKRGVLWWMRKWQIYKKNHMNVPWEKYRSESSVDLINNTFVFFSVNFLNPTPLPRTEDQALAEGWRNDASCGITRHCIPSRFYKNCLASILHPDIFFEADLKKKIAPPVCQTIGRLWLKQSYVRCFQSRATCCIYISLPSTKNPGEKLYERWLS